MFNKYPYSCTCIIFVSEADDSIYSLLEADFEYKVFCCKFISLYSAFLIQL